MTGSSTLLTGAAGILAASVAATYWIDRVFHPSGKLGWALRIGLPALGAIAAGLVAWYARKAARATSSGANAPPPADDIALRFKEAERRLRTADFEVPRRSLAALPTAVVLGPPGTGKTTAIARSAMVTE
nr:hypothetical protein [Gemmatimonadaceae bacterium]